MSAKLMGEVWSLDLPQHEKLVALALADHGEDDGSQIFPSVARLAWKTGYTERRVQQILRSLEEKGLIEPVAHAQGGRGHAAEYQMYTERVKRNAPFSAKGEIRERVKSTAQRVKSSAERVKSSAERVKSTAIKGEAGFTPTIIDSSLQPSVQPSGVAAAAGAAPPAPVAEKPSPPVVPSRPKKAGRQETPEETAYYAACVPALAEVCQVDLRVPGEWARCKKPLQALYHATVRPTPALIRQHYGTAGGYWYASDFRGKKGEAPEPHFVQNTWGKATSAAPRVVPASGTNARAAPSKSERTAAAVDEYLRDLRQGPTSGTQILDAQGKVIYG